MSEDNYRELCAAIRDLDAAKKNLAACERRVAELAGLVDEGSQYKPAKKAIPAREYRRLCNERGAAGGRALDRPL